MKHVAFSLVGFQPTPVAWALARATQYRVSAKIRHNKNEQPRRVPFFRQFGKSSFNPNPTPFPRKQ